MANMFKKTFAMTLVLCMLVSMLPIQALAEDEITPPEGEVTLEVTGETPTVVIDFTPGVDDPIDPVFDSQLTTGDDIEVEATYEKNESADEQGNAIVTETIETTTVGTLADGSTVEGNESYSETTTLNPEGIEIGNSAELEGQETVTSPQMAITPEDTDLPEVEVNTVPGENAIENEDGIFEETRVETEGNVETETIIKHEAGETEGTKVTVNVTETTTEVTGDVKTGEDDAAYDYTETETVIDREVTVNMSDVVTESEEFSEVNMNPVGPEDYEGKVNILTPGSGDKAPNYGQVANGLNPQHPGAYDKYEITDDEGNVTEVRWYPNSNRKQEEYDVLPDEIKAKYRYDEEKGLYRPVDAEGNWKAEGYSAEKHGVWWDYVYDSQGEESTSGEAVANNHYHPNAHFVLYDKAGNRAYAYCMDAIIGTDTTVRYTIENLDEAAYFKGTPEEQEKAKAHVRAIAKNGYWGVEEGEGSLSSLVSGLETALRSGEFVFDYTYTEGGVTYDYDSSTEEGLQKVLDLLVNNINEGDALVATQGSFWKFGRANNNFLGFNPYRKNSPNGMEGGGAELRMELISRYLVSDYLMDKVASDEAARETTIIDGNNFLASEGISLTVGDKVQEIEDATLKEQGYDNYDSNEDNDVYEVDLSFTMVVEPSTAKGDDLVVSLYDAEGNLVRKARLAGSDTNDDSTFSSITKNGSTYTFEDLQLAENTDLTFDLRLEGIQNLEKGVYIYKATAGYDKNQTLVGLSEGTRNVSVNSKFTINFEVTESKTVVATRYWRSSTDPVNTPEEENPPVRFRNPPPTIPDEPVPLADVPQTGDISVLWFAMILFSGCGLCALKLFEKKFEA